MAVVVEGPTEFGLVGGVVCDAMECARLYWGVQSSHPPRLRVCFVSGNCVPGTLDLAGYNQGTWHPPVLGEACPPQGCTVARETR